MLCSARKGLETALDMMRRFPDANALQPLIGDVLRPVLFGRLLAAKGQKSESLKIKK
jgi:hypothetical protein